MDALGKQLKRKSVFVQNQWDGLIPGLQRSSYDLAVNGIEITDDRKQQVNCSIPYYVCGEQLSVRAVENSINSIADLKSKTVGTLKFSLAHRLLEDAKKEFSGALETVITILDRSGATALSAGQIREAGAMWCEIVERCTTLGLAELV